MSILKLRTVFAFLSGLLLVFASINIPRPTAAQTAPFLGGDAVIADISQLPDIPIQNFPSIPFSEELANQLDAIGSQLSTVFNIGEMVNPADILMIGNVDLFGLPQLSLEQIGELTNFDLSSVSLDQVTQLLDGLTPAKLLETIGLETLADTLLQDAPLLSDLASQLGTPTIDMSVAGAIEAIPGFGDTPLSEVDPAALANLTLGDSVPGLTSVPLQNIPDISTLPLSSLDAAGISQLSLGQMPNPLGLAPGFQLGVADIALGDPDSGDREQQRMRVVSGGITDSDMQLTGARCTGNSCPHFEISTGDPQIDGSAWMDATGQRVPDGFGLLCEPFGCEGPPGNHPFGEAVRVLLRDIDQLEGTAQVALSFPVCKTILFIGKTCTPWIFPTPEGIPVATIAEKSIVPFVMPSRMTDGEVAQSPRPITQIARADSSHRSTR